MALVQLRHVGVGCNRVVGAVAWGPWVAYGAHHAVVVYDPEVRRLGSGSACSDQPPSLAAAAPEHHPARPPAAQEACVLGTLLGHTGVVNCVCWAPAGHFAPPGAAAAGGPALLASGAADGTVRLWLWAPPGAPSPWEPLATLEVGAPGCAAFSTDQAPPPHTACCPARALPAADRAGRGACVAGPRRAGHLPRRLLPRARPAAAGEHGGRRGGAGLGVPRAAARGHRARRVGAAAAHPRRHPGPALRGAGAAAGRPGLVRAHARPRPALHPCGGGRPDPPALPGRLARWRERALPVPAAPAAPVPAWRAHL